jgi:hypothetical protein
MIGRAMPMRVRCHHADGGVALGLGISPSLHILVVIVSAAVLSSCVRGLGTAAKSTQAGACVGLWKLEHEGYSYAYVSRECCALLERRPDGSFTVSGLFCEPNIEAPGRHWQRIWGKSAGKTTLWMTSIDFVWHHPQEWAGMTTKTGFRLHPCTDPTTLEPTDLLIMDLLVPYRSLPAAMRTAEREHNAYYSNFNYVCVIGDVVGIRDRGDEPLVRAALGLALSELTVQADP